MIDEKTLIEALKQRMKLHEKDAAEIGSYAIECNGEELLLRLADEVQAIIEVIESQPKVNEWIPVSDKLPDESFEGLEWTMDEDGKPIACDVLVTFVSESENNKRYVTDATYFPSLELSESFTVNDVIAWMSLPPAYKGGE